MERICRYALVGLAIVTLVCNSEPAHAAEGMKPARELIRRQEPAKVSARLMQTISPAQTSVRIDLSEQRAYLMVKGEVAIETPISSGKSAGMTPTGSYKVTEKDIDHRSNIYGNFVDSQGRVVRSGVSMKIDSAPSGTRFLGAPMKYFMRFNGGVGMHIGHLPGYAASHGCIRMPSSTAELFYRNVQNGTPVSVVP